MSKACYIVTLTVFFCIHTLSGKAQDTHQHQQAGDTTQINNLLRHASSLDEAGSDSALLFLQQALTDSKKAGFKTGTLKSYRKIADNYYRNGLSDKCRATSTEALQWCDSSETGNFYRGIFYDRIASTWAAEGNFTNAIQYYMKAISVRLNGRTKAPLAVTYSNLGVLFNNYDQPGQALYYLNLAEGIYRTEYPENLDAVFYNQSISYEELKDQANNISRLKMAIALSEKLHDNSVLIPALDRLGMQYMTAGNNEEAVRYSMKALSIHGNIDLNNQIAPYYTLGHAYMRMHNYRMSEKYFRKYLEVSEPLGMVRELAEAHHSLASLYDSMNQPLPALKHMQAYLFLHDSLSNEETKQSVNQMEIKYRTAQKEKAIKEKQLQIAGQQDIIHRKNMLLNIAILVSLLLFSASIIIWQRQRYKRRAQGQQMANLVQEQKYEKLQAQIHGEEAERSRIAREIHDGFGSLLTSAGINMNLLQKQYPFLSENEQYQTVKSLIADTSKGLRDTAHNLMPDFVLRHSLPEAVRLFCSSVKAGPALHISIQDFGDFTAADNMPDVKLNSYRIIQELINNTIKHAGATSLLVEMTVNGPALFITAEDNGNGFAAENMLPGIGLDNIKSRVNIMRGNVEITSVQGTGTTVQIEIPLIPVA